MMKSCHYQMPMTVFLLFMIMMVMMSVFQMPSMIFHKHVDEQTGYYGNSHFYRQNPQNPWKAYC